MNKRRRELLAALAPAVEFVREHADVSRETVPGLACKATASGTELMIYGPIGSGGFFDSGIGAADVAAALRDAGAGPIDVRLNSPGGDVFQGVAIHTLLARHPGTVTVHVDGLAASAASFIMLAGDRIRMAKHAMVMIHDGMTGTYGNSATLTRAAELLDKVSGTMAEMYADRAGEDAEHWRALMTVNAEDGTWFTGQEAYDAGLVDELTDAPGEDDEDTLVWDRLAAWRDRLPTAVVAKLDEHEPTPVNEEQDDDPALAREDFEDPALSTEEEDYAHAMAMWAWMNKNGHTARKEVAL
jgi:ATP-dependent protease ClpP protease subunit